MKKIAPGHGVDSEFHLEEITQAETLAILLETSHLPALNERITPQHQSLIFIMEAAGTTYGPKIGTGWC
nr:hypothetical protein CFP56_69127 [Quercus suber]